MSDKEGAAYLELQNLFLSRSLRVQESEACSLPMEVHSLQTKVEESLCIISKQVVKKDSHNSSLPPSSDIVPKTKILRNASALKSGGQKGHKGSTLEMYATPTTIIGLKSDFCSACGLSLKDATYSLQARRQVIEIPPIAPIYEEYQQYACTCPGCSHVQKANFPAEVTAPIQYGSSVAALASYFSVYQYVPFRRLRELFTQVFNLPFSEGTVGNLLEKASQKCGVVYAEIKKQLSQSTVAGSDETGAKVDGSKWRIWVWQNTLNTLLVATDNRGTRSIESVWKDGLQDTVLVSDRWAAQLNMPVKEHQLCLAHMLRDVQYLEECEKHSFATNFKKLLTDVFTLRKDLLQKQQPLKIEDAEATDVEKRLDQLLGECIDKQTQPQTHTFQASMLKHRHYLLPCLYNLEIPPDNNGPERAIRNVKVKQKVSGQFKTGQNFFCIIRSVIDTLRKRNIPLITAPQNICKVETVYFPP